MTVGQWPNLQRQRHLTIRVELNQTGALLCLLAGKMVGGQTAVPIILTIDRACSVLCLICLVCQVKGAPLVLVGTKSINKPSTDRRAFPMYSPELAIVPSPSVGIIIFLGPATKWYFAEAGGLYFNKQMHLRVGHICAIKS